MHANKKIDALIEKARQVMAVKHLSIKTEKSYLGWIARYSRFVIANPAGTTNRTRDLLITSEHVKRGAARVLWSAVCLKPGVQGFTDQ